MKDQQGKSRPLKLGIWNEKMNFANIIQCSGQGSSLMIPLGDLREDGPFDKPSFSRNILMSFVAWKSLLFAHFLTVANKKGEGREAAADRAGSSRCLCTILRGDGVC